MTGLPAGDDPLDAMLAEMEPAAAVYRPSGLCGSRR